MKIWYQISDKEKIFSFRIYVSTVQSTQYIAEKSWGKNCSILYIEPSQKLCFKTEFDEFPSLYLISWKLSMYFYVDNASELNFRVWKCRLHLILNVLIKGFISQMDGRLLIYYENLLRLRERHLKIEIQFSKDKWLTIVFT